MKDALQANLDRSKENLLEEMKERLYIACSRSLNLERKGPRSPDGESDCSYMTVVTTFYRICGPKENVHTTVRW